ncbi:hypothetical protein BGW39_009798 [Mortierella sp. 14UC]|nr:hypothetical protein BGW39_009798 [Mortierella sp. 14UC]
MKTMPDQSKLKIDDMVKPDAPICWSAVKSYTCIQPHMGQCHAGFANINTCYIRPPKSAY